jgi:hypothetical protein
VGRFIDWLDDPEKKIFTANEALKQRLKSLSVSQLRVWNRDYMMDLLAYERNRRAGKAGV